MTESAQGSGGIQLQNLSKNYGSVKAVNGIDLDLPDGKFVCLLGPSGCGKTTLLRLIAGLETPNDGNIVFNGSSIQNVPSYKRDFGMVFQSLALFPHLNVAENIGYSLRIRREPAHRIKKRVDELLEMVALPGVGGRRITQLSGGQRQRVAIARALATEPKLFLLDEPLSALDAKLREAMQVELRQLQKKLGITTIVVTHDQREAMTMADHVVIMKDGKILQHGPPLEIYRSPENAFIADFIGTSNLLPCHVMDEKTVQVFDLPAEVMHIPASFKKGDKAVLSIRPEDLHLDPDLSTQTDPRIAKVAFIRDLGSQVEIMLRYQGYDLISSMPPKDRSEIQVGDEVALVFFPDSCAVVSP